MRTFKKLGMVILVFGIMATFAGCMREYDVPEYVEITPSQTAFLIPMQGKTSDQKEFMSEKFLSENKVASKRIQIPHDWIQTGRYDNDGKYVKRMQLILVERKPETREWTEAQGTGTSNKNEGITAESKESIGFMVRMNCSAQIDEQDAIKFLHRYNNKSLSEIMDSEIRARIESKFVEECAKRDLSSILTDKENIMKIVREDVLAYFNDRGITITVIGLKGEFTYLNPAIQEAIDNKFKTAQALVSQKNENERVVSKAKADAEAVSIQAGTLDKTIELKRIEVSSKNADAAIEMAKNWKPTTVISGMGSSILNLTGGK